MSAGNADLPGRLMSAGNPDLTRRVTSAGNPDRVVSAGNPDLARAYRRLIWAYPPSFRRLRGPELVTTMLDAAPPDRERPTRSEAVDLIRSGLRCWLRVHGPAAIVAAVAAAIVGAVALGAFGGYLGWQSAGPLPASAEAARLAQPVLPPGAPPQARRWDFLFDDRPGYSDPRWAYWIGGTDAHEHGQVFFDLPGSAVPAADAQRALRASGWDVTSADPVRAHRGRWGIEVSTEYPMGDPVAVRRISVYRDIPALVRPLTAVGLGTGALAGWLLVAWAGRRRRPGQVLPGLAVTGGLAALVPATLLSAAAIAAGFASPHEPIPGWAGYAFIFARGLALLGGISLLVAAAAVAWPARSRTPRGRTAPAG
jgi:hypothetical protein